MTCTEGSLGLAINNLDEDRPLLRSYFCKDNTLTLQDQAGSKPMAYFESSPECDLRVDNEVIGQEEGLKFEIILSRNPNQPDLGETGNPKNNIIRQEHQNNIIRQQRQN